MISSSSYTELLNNCQNLQLQMYASTHTNTVALLKPSATDINTKRNIAQLSKFLVMDTSTGRNIIELAKPSATDSSAHRNIDELSKLSTTDSSAHRNIAELSKPSATDTNKHSESCIPRGRAKNECIWLIASPDIDECESSQNLCQQLCINVPGSYNCDCHYGFRLDSNRASCSQGIALSCCCCCC